MMQISRQLKSRLLRQNPQCKGFKSPLPHCDGRLNSQGFSVISKLENSNQGLMKGY